MKTLFKISVLIALPLTVWATWTYPRVGELAYDGALAVETRLYGLHEDQVDIGEMSLSVYLGGPRDGAEAVVLLHGFSAEKGHWARFARHLVDDYQVVIPDLAGHGRTGFKPEWDYSIPAQAARIAALLDRLQISQAHIVGNSMGGFTAAHFALTYPARTLSATLIDPAGVQSPQASDMEKMLAAGRNPFEVSSRPEFAEFYAMTMADPPWVPGYVLDALADRAQARRPELRHIFGDFTGRDMLDGQLSQIKAPVLLLWGRDDQLIHVSSTQVWKAGIPQIQVEIWDGIGHMPMVEAPGRSAALFRSFIAHRAAGSKS